MKSNVYSWRLSSDLKTELETEARRRKVSLSALLEILARDGLAQRSLPEDAAAQSRLQAEARKWIGTLDSGKPGSESVRSAVRERLRAKAARRRRVR